MEASTAKLMLLAWLELKAEGREMRTTRGRVMVWPSLAGARAMETVWLLPVSVWSVEPLKSRVGGGEGATEL